MYVLSHFPKTLLITFFFLMVTGSSFAQIQPKQVDFSTEDGVLIKGTWYQSPKGGNSPVVLILHDWGSDRSKNEWVNLATQLQKNNFHVLTFDFRGHGESVTAAPKFWNYAIFGGNQLAKAPQDGKLDYKNFSRNYHSYLINDIAAAKVFLDLKNDAGQCNSSSLILVGAGNGAALGSIWLNSEWYRHMYLLPNGVDPGGPNFNHVYGEDVVACVWLSYINRVGAEFNGDKLNPRSPGYKFDVARILERPALTNNTPMLFIYNPNDTWDKFISPAIAKLIKDKSSKFNNKLTLAFPIKGANELKGRQLLQNSLNTNQAIVEYLTKAPIKMNVPRRQDFMGNQFLWVIGNQIIRINNRGANTLGYHSYLHFMPKKR